MNINSILNHKLITHSKDIVNLLDDSILGRVARQKTNNASYTHVLYLIKNIMGNNCTTVLETGTLWGGGLLTMMQDKHKSTFVSVDMFTGFYPDLLGEGNTDSEDGINTVEKVTNNINNNNPHNHIYELVKGSSHDDLVVKYIHTKYPVIDLFFIDGDHTKKGVLQDWDDYSPLISSGGIVIFDDYWSGDLSTRNWRKEFDDGTPWMDVVGAVDEITNSVDFINNWKVIGLYGDKKIVQKL